MGSDPHFRSDPHFAVVELGPVAARVVRAAQRGRVVAVFERSAYVEIGDALICVGVRRIGSGPLNVLLATDAAIEALRALDGVEAGCDGVRLRIGALALELAGARRWRPAPLALPVDAARLASGVARLRSAAGKRAPHEGLGFLVRGSAPATALASAAAPAASALHAWLAAGDRRGDVPHALAALVGLGPGLTPSGDDFLGGALIALHAFGARTFARRLHAGLRPLLTTRTHPISAALVDAAGEGFGNEALHACLHDLVAARDPQRSLARIAAIGHTSGWDALAGAVTVAGALAGAPAEFAQAG